MTTQTLTLELGEPLYQRLQERAQRTQRTVEAEALDLVAQGVLDLEDLEPALAAAIADLRFLDDAALWHAARMHMAPADSDQLQVLHLKRQRDGLSEREADAARALTGTYERIMVMRAEAAALLKERGYDVAVLRSDPPRV